MSGTFCVALFEAILPERLHKMAAAMSSDQGAGEHSKKKRNYKLLVDPELKKGAIKKIYRFDGVIPGVR